jgi:hypothetical protein
MAAFCLLPAGTLRAGSGARGTSAAAFLKIEPGARPAAMGAAFSAVAGDAHAAYYNPAGLAAIKQVSASAMHEARFSDISYDFATLSVPLLSWVDTPLQRNAYGVMAVSFYSLAVGGLERRGATETDEPVDTFKAGDFAYALSYAYELPDRGLALGGTAKFVDSTIDGTKARALAVDGGALYRLGSGALALGWRHLGTAQKFRQAADPLPLTYFMAGSWRFSERILGSAEFSLPRDDAPALAAGGEYRVAWSRSLSAAGRVGFNTGKLEPGGLSGLSAGMGLGYNGLDLDLAWLPAGELGDTFRYSLTIRF